MSRAEDEVLAENERGIEHLAQGRRADAAACFERAVALAEAELEAGATTRLEALYNRATCRGPSRSAADATADLQAIVAALEKKGGRGDREGVLLESALHNLAVSLEELGRPAEAVDGYARSLARVEERLGPDHPRLRPTLVRLAQLHQREGRFLLAVPLYDRALAIAERELGPNHTISRAIRGWRDDVTGG